VTDDIDAFQVVDLVDRLVDKSLVDVEDVADTTRYRLLETIRAYAFERLETAGRADEARARHAEHFTEFAEQAGAGLRGPDDVSGSNGPIATSTTCAPPSSGRPSTTVACWRCGS
jgi:hypothetical protein